MRPHATCFQTVHGMRQPDIIKFTKMQMRLSVWEFRTGSKFGGGLPVPIKIPQANSAEPADPVGTIDMAHIVRIAGRWIRFVTDKPSS